MNFELVSLNNNSLIQKQAADEILKCNDLTARFGLVLSEKQALELVHTRSVSLQENGRIEFGGGIIDKLIHEFCDSPYIHKENYEQTLHDLIEIFYYYKNETLDFVSDDDLIKYMKTAFDGSCQGSLALLAGREMDTFARCIRDGHYSDDPDDLSLDEEDEDE